VRKLAGSRSPTKSSTGAASTWRRRTQEAEGRFEGLRRTGPQWGMAFSPNVVRAVQAARAGEDFHLYNAFAGSVQGDVAGAAPRLSFLGGPDTIAKQMKEFYDQCGAGVVDLFFQQPGVNHGEVMKEIELFGKEVLPRIKEF
jgi:alkanesulfonate monooxygenase SsuD/methylene tetrahydromethanopterin reductase-like flavin-dependent oxidoreductase (luciferase family)